MQPAGPGAFGVVGVEEPDDLGFDLVEVTRLEARVRRVGVAVAGVARPHHRVPGVADGGEETGEPVTDLLRAHTTDQRETARDATWVEGLTECEDVVGLDGWPDLAADRILDASEELHMGIVETAGALADPEHVGRAVVPVAGGARRVLTGEGFLVAEEQRLVRGVEVDLVDGGRLREVDAAGRHEPQRRRDAVGDGAVTLAFGRGADELLVPGMDPGEVGETALGEGPEQVQSLRALLVRLDHPLRIRCA